MRYILIDRLLELDRGKRARAVKCVTRGEEFLAGLDHYPAALVLEALLQVGGILARSEVGPETRSALGKVEHAEFPGRAVPGDRIELEANVIVSRAEGKLCEGLATVDGEVIARARFMIFYLPPELMPAPDPEIDEQRRLLYQALGVPWEVT